MRPGAAISALAAALLPLACAAQALPRLGALYPAGGQAGTTLEVAIQGGGLNGATELLVDGPGLTARIRPSTGRGDAADKKRFEASCAQCHELRGPAQLARTPEQWSQTVDRMIRQHSAPIEDADRTAIVRYLQAEARAAAGLSAEIAIAADAPPGARWVRVVAADGTSTALPFQVGGLPELLETEPNNDLAGATALKLPAVVNGRIAPSDSDHFRFQAAQGERLTFECVGSRLNEATQEGFFPVLTLFDSTGKELAQNHGYFGLDPLLDWTCPATGEYTVAVRDMLYRGSPASVYRLICGALPYNSVIYPPGAQLGSEPIITLLGENLASTPRRITVPEAWRYGLRLLQFGQGSFPFVVGEHPDVLEVGSGQQSAVTLPAAISGRISNPGEVDSFIFDIGPAQTGLWSFELYSGRVNSRLIPRVSIRDERGRVLAALQDQPDGLLDYTFARPGRYRLDVADGRGAGGPTHIYRVEAAPGKPGFSLTAAPDTPIVGPGGSVLVQVTLGRFTGLAGPVTVEAVDLPPGVVSSTAALDPGRRTGFLVLTAAPDAKPGLFSKARVVGRAEGPAGPVVADAVPLEYYRIQNQARTRQRESFVVSVGPAPPWRVRLEAGSAALSSRGSLTLKLTVERGSEKRDLSFALAGLPPGVEGPRNIVLRGAQSEQTISLSGSTGGVFAAKGEAALKGFWLTAVNGREGESQLLAAPPLWISLGMPAG